MIIRSIVFLSCLLMPVASALAQWANEPAGSTVLLDCGFDTPTCEGRLSDPYHTAGSTVTIQQDSTAPLSPSNVLRSTMDYQAKTGGTELHYTAPTELHEVFVGLWWRSNPDFTGNFIGANKTFFIRGGQNQNGVFYWQKSGSTSRLFFSTQWSWNLDQCGGVDQDQCFGNVNDVHIVPGTWYRIEVYVKASSCVSCRDGTFRWWINGILCGNYVNFAYGPRVDEWLWSETWDGGGNGQGFTSNPSHYLDHLHISTGGGGSSPPPSDTTPPGRATGLTIQQLP